MTQREFDLREEDRGGDQGGPEGPPLRTRHSTCGPEGPPLRPRHRRPASLSMCAVLVLPAGVALSAAGATWRIGQGDVSVKCPMTIGGSFDAKTNALSG